MGLRSIKAAPTFSSGVKTGMARWHRYHSPQVGDGGNRTYGHSFDREASSNPPMGMPLPPSGGHKKSVCRLQQEYEEGQLGDAPSPQ